MGTSHARYGNNPRPNTVAWKDVLPRGPHADENRAKPPIELVHVPKRQRSLREAALAIGATTTALKAADEELEMREMFPPGSSRPKPLTARQKGQLRRWAEARGKKRPGRPRKSPEERLRAQMEAEERRRAWSAHAAAVHEKARTTPPWPAGMRPVGVGMRVDAEWARASDDVVDGATVLRVVNAAGESVAVDVPWFHARGCHPTAGSDG